MVLGILGFSLSEMNTAKKTKKSCEIAGRISDEVFSAVTTVQSLNGEDHELKRYLNELKVTKSIMMRSNRITSIFFGVLYSALIVEYTFGWLIGAIFIKNSYSNSNFGRDYEMKDIYLIFFVVVHGSLSLGMIGPNLETFLKGRISAKRIFDVIET